MTKEQVYDVIKYWDIGTVDFYFKIRNKALDEFEGSDGKVEQLLNYFQRSLPIVNPPITPFILKNLTSIHLMHYLGARDYIVLPKGKLLPIHPSGKESRSPGVYQTLVQFALKDYKENVTKMSADELEDFRYQFGDILKKKYEIKLKDEVQYGEAMNLDLNVNWVDEVDLDLVLEKYCNFSLIKRDGLAVNEKKALVEKTLDILAGRPLN